MAQEQMQRPASTEVQAKAATQQGIQKRFTYPNWPTSRPGPHATPPPAGTTPISPLRHEQVTVVDYNQETGKPVDNHPA